MNDAHDVNHETKDPAGNRFPDFHHHERLTKELADHLVQLEKRVIALEANVIQLNAATAEKITDAVCEVAAKYARVEALEEICEQRQIASESALANQRAVNEALRAWARSMAYIPLINTSSQASPLDYLLHAIGKASK